MFDVYILLFWIEVVVQLLSFVIGVEIRDKSRFDFLWIEDFPLFSPDEESGMNFPVKTPFFLLSI